jgi:hypothetical protein
MRRKEPQDHVARSLTVTDDPTSVFCIEPFAAIDRDNGERLGHLLARLIRDPNRAFLVTTTNAFVFAFANQLADGGRDLSNTRARAKSPRLDRPKISLEKQLHRAANLVIWAARE